MKKNTIKISLLASAISLGSGAAQAMDLRIDGFASVVYGQVLDKDEIPPDIGAFYGYDEKANFQNDSVYGIQFLSDLTEGLTATGQIVGSGSNDFDARITWAYFTYQATKNLDIKAGRQRVPFYLFSDFVDVGYAYVWVSPPSDIYETGGFTNLDGVTFQYTSGFAGWTSRLSLIVGASDTEIEDNGDVYFLNTEDFWDVTWNLSKDWFTFQMTYSLSSATLDAYVDISSAMSDVLAGMGRPLTEQEYNLLAFEDDKGEFAGVGIMGEWTHWLLAAEYISIKLEESPISTDRSTWYVMGGFRWDQFTIALTYSEFEEPNNEATLMLLDEVTPMLEMVPELAPLVANLDRLYRSGATKETYTLSMRYDFHPSAAFKVEYMQQDYTNIYLSEGSEGSDVVLNPSLIRMGVDLVF